MFAGKSVLLFCQHTFYQEAVRSVAFCTFNVVSDTGVGIKLWNL
jgi:hypothetical protein